MQESTFQTHIKRLQANWGEQNYRLERVRELWKIFQNENGDDFRDAVSDLLLTQRAAPMLPELSKAVEAAKLRRTQLEARGLSGGFAGQVIDAAKANKRADPEIVKACMKLLKDKVFKRLTPEQFEQGCDLLAKVADGISPETRARSVPQRNYTAPRYTRGQDSE
jgi:hypothetical protein